MHDPTAEAPAALYLEHLLRPFGIELGQGRPTTKLLRHIDQRIDVQELYRRGELQAYQSIQTKPMLDGVELVLSFLGLPPNQAVFIGAYAVGPRSSAAAYESPADSPVRAIWSPTDYHYQLTKAGGLAPLEDRLVIDWGKGALSWSQWFRPQTKPVIELLPTGYEMEFPGYLDVVLDLHQLRRITEHRAAHRTWHQMLGATAGVYLILDKRTGAQYVGSAYGGGGILGRWTTYATNSHGGNAQLRELIAVNPNAADHFQFSILQTLPMTLTPREVIEHERRHKQKLGSRAHGLNSN